MTQAIRDEIIEELLQGYSSPQDLVELWPEVGDGVTG